MIISAICLIILIIVFSFHFNSEQKAYHPIRFPVALDSPISNNTELVYNVEYLEEQITSEDYYVYTNPKLTDYSIVEKFGFNINNYSLTNDGEERFYEMDGRDDKKTLWIDKFGCFIYDPGVSSPSIDMKLSAKECNKIAVDFLKNYGLYSDEISHQRSVNESWNHTSKGSKLLGLGINFYLKKRGGTGKILVKINAKGEVVYVMYNLREYDSKQQTDLISIEDAIKRFKEGNAFIEVENPSKKLSIESVELSYYSQDSNEKNLLMQPVYIFSGTSKTYDGKTEPFAITVQAN